jgi:ADP-ribose pyrophosphatase
VPVNESTGPERGDPARREGRAELLSSESLHRGRIFDVTRERVRLPSGLEQQLEIVRHAGAVAIAALDAEGRLVLVRQYRQAVGEWLVEVPAGRLEPGEDPETAARRELEEETGLRARRWSVLARFWPAPGFCSEQMTLFLAQDLEPAGASRRAHDADEELEVVRMTPAALFQESRDAKSLVAAAYLAQGVPGSR